MINPRRKEERESIRYEFVWRERERERERDGGAVSAAFTGRKTSRYDIFPILFIVLINAKIFEMIRFFFLFFYFLLLLFFLSVG